MDEKNKLSILIHHWIEHNESHMTEYKKWAKNAGEQGLDSVRIEIEHAAEKLNQCNQSLQGALKGI